MAVIAGIIGPQRTIGCFVNFSADYLEPGIITYGGSGSLYLGELDGAPSARVQTLAHALSSWGQSPSRPTSGATFGANWATPLCCLPPRWPMRRWPM